jgi:single-strand DNA-binding protein
MSINNVVLTGRAGRDPEVRYFESGSAVANLSIAVDRFRREDDPDWFEVEIWGKQAQLAADYLRKGQLFGLEGRLEQSKWTDRATGEQRSKVVIKTSRFVLLESKAASESRQQRQTAHRQQNIAPPNQSWQSAGSDPSEEEVPF